MALHRTTFPVQYFLQLSRAAVTSTLKTYAENMSEILVTRLSARLHGVISHETTIFSCYSDGPVLWNEGPVSFNTYNGTLRTDFTIPYVRDISHERINKHHNNLKAHPNPLLEPLLQPTNTRRLKRCWPFDLQST